MMDHADVRNTGRLSIAAGAVAAGSAVCLAIYFAVGPPFGTINDIGNAATGVLGATLAWRLRRQVPGPAGSVAAGLALAGAGLAVAGSALVISGTTTFLLAGFVSSVGFAGIGVWLMVVNRRGTEAPAWPSRLRALGVAAGAAMALGILCAPGIVLRIDDLETAPAWVWIGSVGWLGTYVLYPAWAVWLGLVERRLANRPRTQEVTTLQPTSEAG
ncbi:MAG: hypothetical protein QOD65_2451 [Gaiellales bacterium]|nr:hypothetical protein [Gaiellales bacterium]